MAELRERTGQWLGRLSATGRSSPVLRALAASAAALEERLARRTFVVAVLGEVTKGKSELVNALVDRRVLPTGVRPTTLVPHLVRWGPEVRAWVELPGGERRPLDPAALAGRSAPQPAEPGARVVVEASSELLRAGLSLVDTPGANDITERGETVLAHELPESDAALFVIDARYVLTRSEATFLQDLLPRGCRDRLVLALTKADRLDERERAEVASWTKEGLAALGLSSVPWFMVSARGALDGDPVWRAELERLRVALRALVGRLSESRLLDEVMAAAGEALEAGFAEVRAREAALAAPAGSAEARAAALARELEASDRVAAEAVEEFRAEGRAALEVLQTELKLFALDFRKALPESLQGASAEDVRKHLPFFIRDAFSDWLTSGLATAQRRVEDAARVAAGRLAAGAEGLRCAAGLSTAGPDVKLDLKVGVSGYDLGVAALSALGGVTIFINLMAGGLLTVAAAAAAVQFRRSREAEVVTEAVAQGPGAVDETAARLAEALARDFERGVGEVAARLAELHRVEAERLTAALREARALCAEGGANRGATVRALAETRSSLEGRSAELAALREEHARAQTPA